MKRRFLLVLMIVSALSMFSCSKTEFRIEDIKDLPNETPVSIEYYYDDPGEGSVAITDTETIRAIMEKLQKRVYEKVKTVTPGTNAKIILTYLDGTEVKISLNGITDSNGKKYQPITKDDLDYFIISYLASAN